MKRSIPFAKLSLLEVASSRALFGGTLLMLAVIVGTASLMWLEFRRTEAQDRKQLELLASVMESHASQVFDNTKLTLDSLAKNLTTENHTPAQLEAQQSYRLQGLPFSPATDERVVIGAWVHGRTLTQDMRNAAVPAGLGYIPMVRLVRLPSNAVVTLVAQINPDALATYQRQLMEAGHPGTQVMLALDNGTLLTQVGNDTLNLGSSLGTHPLFQGLLPAHKGTYGPLQTFQARSLGAWRSSNSQPLVAFVEQPYEATTQQWLAAMRGPLLFMGVALALIGLLTHASWRNARAKEVAQRERDEAQQETARREQELSVLFRSVQELIFRTDAQGTIRFVNPRWHAITNQPAEMARGQRLRDVVNPECRDGVDALFDATQPPGVRMAQVRLTGPAGETRALDISVVPLRDRSGQLRGFAGSAVDVTALLAAQQSLQEQLALTSQVLECNPLPICMTDTEGRLLSVNQAWESFMGLSRKSVLGMRNIDFLPRQEAQAYCAHQEQLLREGGRVRYEERMRRPDGSFRDVQVTKVLVTTNGKQPIGILTAKMDITEFRAARDLAEEASRSKSEFVANISHELRTPLQSILGFSELGLARGRHQSKLASMFSDIHDAGQRMLVLVNDLLDIAKIESTVGAFQFERADVRDLIEEVAAEMELLLDRKRLPRGVPGRHCIHIQVRDQGPGIPPAELETVFQAFVQSSKTRDGSGGTGLGLAICRKIVEAHGGRIHATNGPDGGTIFHIMLLTAGYTDTMPAPLT